MNMPAKPPRARRSYQSPLRERQAEETRQRILDSFAAEFLEESAQDFSIARVAQRAGVAPRTVYHHFPNRDSILAALQEWFETHVTFPPVPKSTDAIREYVHSAVQAMEEAEMLVRAVLASGLARKVRQWSRPHRRRMVERMVRSIEGLTEEQVQRGTAVLHYLCSLDAWRSLKDESGLRQPELAETLGWAVETLIEDLKRMAAADAATDSRRMEAG